MKNRCFLKTSLKGVLFSNILNCYAMENNKNDEIIKKYKLNGYTIDDEETKVVKVKKISQLKTFDDYMYFLNSNVNKINDIMNNVDIKREEYYNEGLKFISNVESFFTEILKNHLTNSNILSSDDLLKKYETIINSEINNLEIEKKYKLSQKQLLDLGKLYKIDLYNYIKSEKNDEFKLEVLTNEEITKVVGGGYNVLKYLSINPKKKADENWQVIGRGILYYNFTTKKCRNLKKQSENIDNGVINCTIWAELIYKMLNDNGYPAELISTECHNLVVFPFRGKKHTDCIFFNTLEL